MMDMENSSGVGSVNMGTTPDFSKPPPNMEQSPFQSSNINLTPNRMNQQNQNQKYRQPFRPQHNNNLLNSLPDDFDGKRLRKSTMRKTVDYNAAIIKALENRVWQRDHRDRHALQPDVLYLPEVLPPPAYKDNPINAVTTRFVKTATNKMRCPIFCMAWTPEGRRLVTGASSGEFTLWNGLTFNFETILQAHDSPVRSMVWSNNDAWMITGDHAGYCKYWQSNMNNVKMFQAHKEAIRGLSFSPTDQKMVSCSDDGTLRIWDFARCHEERVLRGHGSDVKCCDWHPQLGLIASGSKDNQQPIKLWDPKSGQSLTTLHAHKSTVMDLKWNKNGNWFMTASRDHFLKLFDVRNLSQVVQTFRGHKKEASCLAWHPHHEGLIASGGSDGAILFWHVGADKEVGGIDAAHESIVWTLNWHPLGHILCSGSNDHTSKFWTRNRPGDLMRDKYNLNTLPAGLPGTEENEIDEVAFIPGMAPEDRVEAPPMGDSLSFFKEDSNDGGIPGLDDDLLDLEIKKKKPAKKQPYAKPIPKNFVAQWNETGMTAEGVFLEEEEALEGYGTESVLDPINQLINKFIEQQPGVKKLEELEPTAVVVYGKVLPVRPGQKLYKKIFKGKEALNKYIRSGKIKELQDVLPIMDSDGECAESDSDSSSMEVDPPNEDDELGSNYNDNSLDASLYNQRDVDLRPFGRTPMETDDSFRNFGATGMRDMDLRFTPRDQDFRSSNQSFDEDLRNPPNRPPPLLSLQNDSLGSNSLMRPDLDLRNQFGNNDFNQSNNYRSDYQSRDSDSRNYPSRNNFNNRDVDFRDYDDRKRDSFQRNDSDYRSRDFDSRHRDYDERDNNFDSRDKKDRNFDDRRNFDGRNFDDRPNYNNSNNMFNKNSRWDDGPAQDSNNWPNRPPPLLGTPSFNNEDTDFRNFQNRGFQGPGQGSGSNNQSDFRGKMRGNFRNQGNRSRPARRGRGRFNK